MEYEGNATSGFSLIYIAFFHDSGILLLSITSFSKKL